MIELSHVMKSFGATKAVNDCSLAVREGETFVLLGTSGSGKTTLLKLMNRLLETDKGIIKIAGKDIRASSPEILRRGIGYVLQNRGLFPHYTIQENIFVVPELLGWEREKMTSRAETLARKFDLNPSTLFSLFPENLSGGQQQRVGFIRALMANPPVILMDEPLGALDPVTRYQIRQEFKRLDELKGKTIVLVTHDVAEAIELGDRIGLMDQGRLQQVGTATDLLFHPANDFVKKFFSKAILQYQFLALKVKDLFPFLERKSHSQESPLIVDGESNLFELMEQLSIGKNKAITIQDNQTGNPFSLKMADLFSAYLKIVEDKR